MFKNTQRKKWYSVERVWFPTGPEKSQCDLVRYLRSDKTVTGPFSTVIAVETVLSDITVPVEEIVNGATKTIKYEVNKCAKEDIDIEFFTAAELAKAPEIADEFETAYIDFARRLDDRDVMNAYSRDKIRNMIEEKCILISKASKETITVFHVYAWGGEESCLLYSVSNFRNDKSLRNLAGRMNKLLHVKDISWFKEHGVSLYDWGNISSSKNPNGIDVFKISFGGKITTLYNSFVGNSLKGKCIVALLKLLKKA